MSRPTRIGFTLVELLVVIVIISMLVGLLIPAVQMARARARQTQCMNNQHEIALAVLQYETAKGHFPGYINKFGTGPYDVTNDPRPALSWTTVILPYLGNEAAWRGWRSLRTDTKDFAEEHKQLQVNVPVYVCPSDPSTENTRLSYGANCGLADTASGQPDLAANGVFHNHYNRDGATVAASGIRDGAQQTIMLSENIQAGLWFTDLGNLGASEFELGINWEWVEYADKGNPVESPSTCSPINACRDVGSRPQSSTYARPSSEHPGGVVVSFCDGHQRFLSERIYYVTYQYLMAPEDSKARTPPSSPDSAGLPPSHPQDPEFSLD
jgi:prepilin-type N-terminal cleavage/methylation domain-containing protein/prepilin-type processing-associated H-X9-DG protein